MSAISDHQAYLSELERKQEILPHPNPHASHLETWRRWNQDYLDAMLLDVDCAVEDLGEQELRILCWLATWDDWTVGGVQQLLRRARLNGEYDLAGRQQGSDA